MRLRLTLVTLIAIASLGIGCTALRSRYHSADGSWKVSTVLSDARDGLEAGCASTWVAPADCRLASDALTVADNIAASNTPGVAVAVRQALVTFEARVAPENRIRPYLDWVILLLPQA